MASQAWNKLDNSELYIKSNFSSTTYSIWVTDLCQLYAEELDADDLRWRATKAKVPLDLDEAQNLSTLLRNLRQAVDDERLESKSHGSRYMDLSAAVELPKPLPSFEWTFKLELQPDDKFRNDVTKPLLEQIESSTQREEDLVHRLHDKDHVLERLLDALDKYSVDLADVFPSLASHGSQKRTVSRRDAEAHIPALQSFSSAKWQQSIGKGKRYHLQELAALKMPQDGAADDFGVDQRPATTAPSKGIKRTLGRRTARTIEEPAQSAEPEPPSLPDRSHAHDAKPKGSIKRTLGGRKAVEDRQTPDTAASTTEGPVSPEAKTSTPKKTHGIKRTLGRRSASPSAPTVAKDPTPPPPPEEPIDEEADENRRADQKREALKKQLASTTKPKKRKF